MLTQMEKINNRRKAVIWVSNGYDFNPFAESRLGEDPVFGGRFGQTREEGRQQQGMTGQNQFADADLARELAEVTRTANRANATLYTIDPRGLVAGADLDEQLDPVEFGEHVRKTQDSLRVLAERDRRHRRGEPEQLRQGAEADRRRDERLLHARLLVDEPGSAEADAQDRSEAGEPAGRQRVVADVVLAEAAAAGAEIARRGQTSSESGSARQARAEPLVFWGRSSNRLGDAGGRGLRRGRGFEAHEHFLNPLAQPERRLRLQLDEFLPIRVAENNGDDVIAIVVHGRASSAPPRGRRRINQRDRSDRSANRKIE